MTTTIGHILRALRESRPEPAHVFCHPDDREQVAVALVLLPDVRVVASPYVPAGQLVVATDPAGTHEIGERP
ncbi:hypothetical protein MF672_038895 [Actinomadura sp. ATCC 31491]|uniref:Uncharacterized protein n=1 Tax=Actinomadura luzonensis TaxID=2805427 RepID=A0ABT0G542_9ACTN|nr:hypothetical protein [Actinomadura luzonensis]MCK2219722.1 hypothetical protein [Actinomadura luzonensis]